MTQAATQPTDLLPAQDVPTGPSDQAEQATKVAEFKLLATLFGGMLLLVSVIARYIFDSPDPSEPPMQSQILALASAVVLGTPIVIRATKQLFAQAAGKAEGNQPFTLLVALAFLAAFANSWFGIAGATAFFMLLASFIEDRTAAGAQKQIEALIRITPTRAHKLENGTEIEVAAKDLVPGDIVVVRPGDNIPGDGTVVDGLSAVNQANITGESLPVEKNTGDEVFAGTINETGILQIKITRAEADSTLSKVQDLILQAGESKPAVIRLLDEYAGYYTPVVLMIAGIIWFFTQGDNERVISFLLICCPVEILIAAPSAMVASLTTAARLGVLIKDVSILEISRRVTAIVLDKTGTLTTGKLSVTRLQPTDGTDPGTLLSLAAAVEANSKHPVARAVVAMAEKAKLPIQPTTDFSEVTGRGVIAKVQGQTIVCGRLAFVEEQGIDLSTLDTAAGEGLSLLFLARNGQALGWIGLEDQPRTTSKQAMEELGDLGVKHRIMITGDRPSPARRVARLVGITEFEAEALPGDKLKLVEDLRERGHTVAVVGDGVNDGPALAAGNLSIAMGAAGSDVAIHSASVALMSDSLNRIPFLLYLSKRTVNVIRQNLIGLLIYIVVMLVMLAFGWINPVIVALGHGVASLAVLFNSARLVREGEYLDEFTTTTTGNAARVTTEKV